MYSAKLLGISIIKNYFQIAFKDQQALKSKSKDIINKNSFALTILSCFLPFWFLGSKQEIQLKYSAVKGVKLPVKGLLYISSLKVSPCGMP